MQVGGAFKLETRLYAVHVFVHSLPYLLSNNGVIKCSVNVQKTND